MSVKIQTKFANPFAGQWEEHPPVWEMHMQQHLLIHAETYWERLLCSVLLCSLVQHSVWLLGWVITQWKCVLFPGCNSLVENSFIVWWRTTTSLQNFCPVPQNFYQNSVKWGVADFFTRICMGSCTTQKSFENHVPFSPIVCLCDKPWMPPAVLRRVKMSSQMEHEQLLDNLLLMCVNAKASVKQLASPKQEGCMNIMNIPNL